MNARTAERPVAIPVRPEHVRAVARTVARGFHDNEIWVWLQPHAGLRARLMERNYRILIKRVFLRRGVAWTTPDLAGAALWIAPGEPKRTRADELAELYSLVPWMGVGGMRRGFRIDELVAAHHPHEPHWYLEVLSVDPAHQRSGYGTALLEPGLARCDAEGVPAYLETQRESNVAYYRRFGFELREVISLDDSPPLWTMWREPAR